MTQRFGKQLKYWGNGLDIWGTPYVFVVRHKYVAKDLNILNMPWMWKMIQRFGKWPKYLGNGLDTWDTALVFEKRLYYVGNG